MYRRVEAYAVSSNGTEAASDGDGRIPARHISDVVLLHADLEAGMLASVSCT